MKYERIGGYKRPSTSADKESNQRHLLVNFMEKISTRQKPQQIVKSFNSKRDYSGAEKKAFRGKKVLKETVNKGGPEEGLGNLIIIPNVRQQVREGDAKLLSENKSRKALHGIPLMMAKESPYGHEADNDGVGKNKYHKDVKSNAGKKSDEGGNKPKIDKSRNDSGSTAKEKTERGYAGQARFEKGKSSLELKITEIKSQGRTRQSAQNVPAVDKVSENKFPKKTVNYNPIKHTLPSKDTVPLEQQSAIDKRRKNEINDKIQNRELKTETAGKPDIRPRELVFQAQGRPLQARSSRHGQNTKDPHGHISNIRQTNYSDKQSNYQNYPRKKQRQSVDIVVGSRSKLDHRPSRPSCVKPKPTTLSRADAIRPCDYLRALMEDRETCFPKVCAPCPSTPRGLNSCAARLCDPCQSSIVQCSC